jgi:hypothetical protein
MFSSERRNRFPLHVPVASTVCNQQLSFPSFFSVIQDVDNIFLMR